VHPPEAVRLPGRQNEPYPGAFGADRVQQRELVRGDQIRLPGAQKNIVGAPVKRQPDGAVYAHQADFSGPFQPYRPVGPQPEFQILRLQFHRRYPLSTALD